MSDTIVISKEDMRKIVLYEKDFRSFINEDISTRYDDQLDALDFESDYQITLEDVRDALKNILSKDPDVTDLEEYWRYPIFFYFSGIFGVDKARGYDEDETEEDTDSRRAPVYSYLPADRKSFFDHICEELGELEYEGSERCSEVPTIKDTLDSIEMFLEDEDKPIEQKRFSSKIKKNYINMFRNDYVLEEADDFMLDLCRKYTEELIETGSKLAMEVKAYSQYGGNRLYKCDWISSRDLVLKLYEMTGNAMYANTLGYIYYYGRCTNGEPEYDKAFEMFTAGHAAGYYESTYKLADMFRHGYFCSKNPKIAFDLYKKVFDDCMDFPLRSVEGNLSDAALRMGNCYMNGIGVEKDIVTSYSFFGDASVAIGVDKSLNDVREELPEGYFREYLDLNDLYSRIYSLTYEGGKVSVKKKRDHYEITIGKKVYYPELVSFPEIGYIEIANSITFTAQQVRTSNDRVFTRSILFDKITNKWNGTLLFWSGNRVVLYLTVANGRLYAPKSYDKEDSDKVVIASVSFDENGRTYDYICDIPGVEPGNNVIVETSRGDTEVIVQGISIKDKEDLPIPFERYKTVKEKCNLE